MRLIFEVLSTLYFLCYFFTFVSTEESTAHLTCRVLVSSLQNEVAFPGGSFYNASLSSYAYVQQQAQHPSCIVRPSSASDISTIIKVLRNSPKTAFAIRSGGHGTNRGFSNIDGGITLDLTSINDVKILEDATTVSAGTGATWGNIYPVLDASNRSLTGSRASGVGVGGFLSGGTFMTSTSEASH